MPETVLSARVGAVLTLTLNRPAAYNACTRELALTLQEQLSAAGADDSVRAVIVTGAGRAFCAGQDIGELTGEDAPPIEKILSEHLHPIVRQIRGLRKPVIAAVNGVAAGAGASFALACDITVASDRASFIQAFSKIGLIPDSGSTWTLPRLVGRQRATALMMTGDPVDAATAERIGMIYKSVPHDTLLDEANALAERLAAMPTRALALTKQAVDASATNPLDTQLDLEDRLQREAAQTADYAEGIAAFIAKRRPSFGGA